MAFPPDHALARPLEPPGEAAEAILGELERLLGQSASPARAAFSLSRVFLDTLGAERERIRDEAAEALKAEQAHYKNTTDGAWLEEREEQLKALSEAAAVRARADLAQTLAGWFANVLRVQHGAASSLDRPAIVAHAAAATPRLVLRRLKAVEDTASMLDRGVQEALAVEAGFLNLFTVTE
jgi:DNA polymerase-3 subunit delta'